MFDLIIKEVSNRFNLGNKALPLVQVLVAAMTNQNTGGLSGFIDSFKSKGLVNLVDSWLHTSAPLSINHVQIEEVLGGKGGVLDILQNKVGLDKGTSLLGLAYLLPNLFSKLAPGGNIATSFNSDVAGFIEKGLAFSGAGVASAASSSVARADEHSKVESKGLFDGIIEDLDNHFHLNGKALPLIQSLIAAITCKEAGGLTGFIDRFNNDKLGLLTDSWLNREVPLEINHVQVEEVLGGKGGFLENIIQKIGLDKGSALLSLAYVLPKLIKKLAPDGKLAATPTQEISEFAQKGLALLGGGSALAGILAASPSVSSASTSPPITNVASVPPPTQAAVIASSPIQSTAAPQAAPVSMTKKVEPIPVTPAVVAVDSDEGGGFLKLLPWLIAAALGLGALKMCSAPTEQSVSTPAPVVVAPAPVPPPAPVSEQAPAPTPAPVNETAPAPAPEPSPVPAPAEQPAVAPPAPMPAEEVKAPEQTIAIPSAKIYFNVGKINLPADTDEKLKAVIEYLKANGGAKATVSGYHDPRGSQKQNEKLAKNRAKKVLEKLLSVGIVKESIVMEKPQSTTGTGDNQEARRVEVTINP